MKRTADNRAGWVVVLAGIGLNLALGILYAWSVFGSRMTDAVERGGFGWSKTQATLPFTCAIAGFALMMVPAGRLQDRFGPRITATAGAVCLGLGVSVCSFAGPDNLWPALLGFGLLAGSGLGLGYSAATPAAVKWFPPEKKGLIAGLVVSGFGLAPVYIAPLSTWLLAHYGIRDSFWILGVGLTVFTLVVVQFIRNPHGYDAAHAGQRAAGGGGGGNWREMLRAPRFYLLYFGYASGAAAGLMIIGHLAKIVAVQSGGAIKLGFLFVAVLALFNAGGRILAGIVSDRIGRAATLLIAFLMQATVLLLFNGFSTVPAFLIGSAVVGLNFGACFALFPAAAADYWGTRNLGLNYGILFTSWGVGGVFGPLLAGRIADVSGSYAFAYDVAAALLVVAAALSMLMVRAPAGAQPAVVLSPARSD